MALVPASVLANPVADAAIASRQIISGLDAFSKLMSRADSDSAVTNLATLLDDTTTAQVKTVFVGASVLFSENFVNETQTFIRGFNAVSFSD
jgi:hypothetical protein